MERNTFNIRFYVLKTRVSKNGEVPVVMRVTVNGQRVVTSVNLKVDPKFWNAVAGKSIANTRRDYELNARLDTIRLRVMQIYREMELDREHITAQKVIDKYLGRNSKPDIMLLDIFREHNVDIGFHCLVVAVTSPFHNNLRRNTQRQRIANKSPLFILICSFNKASAVSF